MRIRVECCGAAARWCGAAELDIELEPEATVAALLERLGQRYPELARRRAQIAVAVGDAVAPDERRLQPGDRLALIPPVSGG
jgi:molybdopterin synthase sulfur carrier subunit